MDTYRYDYEVEGVGSWQGEVRAESLAGARLESAKRAWRENRGETVTMVVWLASDESARSSPETFDLADCAFD